jgi:hypothetical protein
MSIKRRLVRFDQKTCSFVVFFVCAAALLIMHVPISELHAQWHYSMSLHSQRFLQFHPTVMLVTYGNSCFIIIRQNFFPVSFSSRIMQLELSYDGVDKHFFSATTGFAHA